ncbi:hypothetical protein ABKV19_021384, partial [Rosa sericea]
MRNLVFIVCRVLAIVCVVYTILLLCPKRRRELTGRKLRVMLIKIRRVVRKYYYYSDSKTEERWSNGLPQEILLLILQRLCISDYLVSSKVCVSWRAAVEMSITKKSCLPAPQLPRLLLSSPSHHYIISFQIKDQTCFVSDGNRKLVSLESYASDIVYFLKKDQSRFWAVYCLGSIEGWLIMAKGYPIINFFLYPVSGARVMLPSLPHCHCFNFPTYLAKDSAFKELFMIFHKMSDPVIAPEANPGTAGFRVFKLVLKSNGPWWAEELVDPCDRILFLSSKSREFISSSSTSGGLSDHHSHDHNKKLERNCIYFACQILLSLCLVRTKSMVVTFWEGEIVDTKNYTFFTEKWEATRDDDTRHWTKFPSFSALLSQVEVDGGKSLDLSNYPYIFMRWKEQYFVNVGTDCGLTIAGFYYVCFSCSDGSINGFYYDPNS